VFGYLLSSESPAIATDLAGCVPTVPIWSLSTLPRFLPTAAVERLLKRCDRKTAVGRRNHAILLLLARLGVRAGEVMGLSLDDIDWSAGLITIHGKGGKSGCLHFMGAQDSRGLLNHFPIDCLQSFDPRLAFIFLLAALFFEQRDLKLVLQTGRSRSAGLSSRPVRGRPRCACGCVRASRDERARNRVECVRRGKLIM
jgi:integrase